jgi:hypothetical protein
VSILASVAVQRSGLDGFDLPLEEVTIVPMPALVERVLGSHIQAITLLRTIIVKPEVFERVIEGSEPELLAHELIHVAQWEDHGMAGFAWAYARDYMRLRMLGATHDAAYRSIGFEYQAYTRAAEIHRSMA